ncbi:MAG TPA: TetR/AcrR family transcriptional regulator [Solirubrobacteraceae bacterium]|nr:TetR/AcrR family transcriptional regulator [Solirubrobacteraceae bacterium]
MQRSRLIAGAVQAIDELGHTRVSVGETTKRAGVSRRTFYELFADREECFVAVIDDAVDAVVAELATLNLNGRVWRERVRAGLASILAFLDREPVLARACVVQAPQAGPRVLARREEALARLATAVDAGRSECARGETCTPLTAEGVVGAVFAIVHTRLVRGENPPLIGLLNELMGMIVLPYLGPAAVRRELAQLELPAPPELASAPGRYDSTLSGLGIRLTYRTALVLEGVRRQPGASNRGIGQYSDVSDAGQISRLLGRLERARLVTNTGGGHVKGEANAWVLTPLGERVAQSICLPTSSNERSRTSTRRASRRP